MDLGDHLCANHGLAVRGSPAMDGSFMVHEADRRMGPLLVGRSYSMGEVAMNIIRIAVSLVIRNNNAMYT